VSISPRFATQPFRNARDPMILRSSPSCERQSARPGVRSAQDHLERRYGTAVAPCVGQVHRRREAPIVCRPACAPRRPGDVLSARTRSRNGDRVLREVRKALSSPWKNVPPTRALRATRARQARSCLSGQVRRVATPSRHRPAKIGERTSYLSDATEPSSTFFTASSVPPSRGNTRARSPRRPEGELREPPRAASTSDDPA